MNTKSIHKLPDSELDVMIVIWRFERPCMIVDIWEALKDIRPCTKPTVHSLLDNLEKKGFVNIEFSPDKQSHKIITPLVTEEEYRADATSSFLNKLCRGRWQTLIAALADNDEISEDDLDEIKALLNSKGKGSN